MVAPPDEEGQEPTAMDLVRQAQRGEIDHQRFVTSLTNWPFKPQYRTGGEVDDWEFVEDSFDAVLHAYIALNLLSEEEYEAIAIVSAKSAGRDRGSKSGST